MKRYEIKFALDEITISELLSAIKMHPAHFRSIYYKRQVNNIYFDSFDLESYIDNVEGEKNRRKIRLRWYGRQDEISSKPILEIKNKSGMLGWKEKFKIKPVETDLKGNVNTGSLLSLDKISYSEFTRLTNIDLKFLQPILLNNYQREYFLSLDNKFRLTIDTQLKFFDLNPYRAAVDVPFQRNRIVVELKFEKSDYEYAEFITNNLPFRLTKSSKYVFGVDRLRNWV